MTEPTLKNEESLAVKHSIQLEDLEKRLETLEFKFNELIDILDKKLGMPTLGYTKVKEQ